MRRKERRRARLKVAVVGATAAGKSALLARLLHGRFVVLHKPTDGCYRHDSAVRLDDGRKLPLELWDTPGKVPFADIAQGYDPSPIDGADGVIQGRDIRQAHFHAKLCKPFTGREADSTGGAGDDGCAAGCQGGVRHLDYPS